MKTEYRTRRSRRPRGLRRGSAAARLMGLRVRIPPVAWTSVCCGYCVLSGRGLRYELITRLEGSYRVLYVCICYIETSRMKTSWPSLRRSATKNMEPTQPPAYSILEAISIGLKHAEREADHSLPPRCDVNISLSHIPTSLRAFIVSCLITYIDFIFFFHCRRSEWNSFHPE
jgi:hypothetical protein